MEFGTQRVHNTTELDQRRGRHYCVKNGCQTKNTFRQSERQDLVPDYEDWMIKMLQATYRIKNYEQEETDANNKTKNFLPVKQTTCQKYYKRWSYILYKMGSLGVFRDYNNLPVFGWLDNVYYNVVGDAIRYDIRPKRWGSMTLDGYRDVYNWNYISDRCFYEELPRKKGIKQQYHKFIKNVSNAADNIRITQDNSIIKYYLDAGTIPEDYLLNVSTNPTVNNSGIAVVDTSMIPKNKDDKTPEEKKKDITAFVTKMRGKGLIKNDYQDNTRESILYYDHCWKVLSVVSGIRESREIKKGNQAGREIEYNNFSYDISENDILQMLQSIVYQWNEAFGEKNYIEPVFNIKEKLTAYETAEGGSNPNFNILGGNNGM